jgi:broad specificity phosphatase PhoE
MGAVTTDSQPTRLLLIRHGRVDFDNRDFRDAGSPRGPQWDPPLDERGREQSELLTARLASIATPSGVYTSPFRRCLETIKPYARLSGIEPTVVDDLGEVHVGEWEGVRFEDLLAREEDTIRRRLHDQDALFDLAPGGETGAELRARIHPTVERIIATTPPGNIVVVAHGGVINAYLGEVMGVPRDMFFFPENTSVSTVDIEGDDRHIRFLGDVSHLALPALFGPPPGALVGEESQAEAS